ncbi:YdhR family protein [Leucobacter soli]|uniref:Monooxygenase YdhR n=1 Tax=Leucobacter soli TaxID=2812850 RepID=A0A916JW98_9MICO|nr:YdhR family protein [Leucobacter soli]CAG7608686.1 Putative monooxygenase YdhR [Leucobacter soli]
MPIVLIMEYRTAGPFGADAADADRVLASDIVGEAGLQWKLWIEDEAAERSGGVYLFDTRADAERYAELQLSRLASAGIGEVEVKYFDVNEPLSLITRGIRL